MRGILVAISGLVLLASACGTPQDRFQDEVAPLLESRCADLRCHGVSAEHPAAGQALDPHRWLTLRVDAHGRLTNLDEAAMSARAKVSAEDPVFSTLLRKTLPVAQGGLPHFQGAVFSSRDDRDYKTLAAWAASVSGDEGRTEPPLDTREKLFADTVYPFLVDRGCATASCHGNLAFGGAFFQPPPLPGTHRLARADLRTTLPEARRNLALTGDPLQSRLLAKILPFEFGGIPHKGGNDVFLAKESEAAQDPRKSASVQAIVAWIQTERKAVLGDVPALASPPIVAVGGPLPAAEPFQVAPFTPGSDLYRLDPPYHGTPLNLTASAHQGPADVRDPALSHDGKTLVFTMRTSETDAHNVYTIGVDGKGLKQLTFDKSALTGGGVAGFFAPGWGPNGGFVAPDGASPTERIYVSSTRSGEPSDLAGVQNADLYAMDPDGQHLERLTWTPVPEVEPTTLAIGEFAGTLAYTIRRSAEGGFKGVLFRFPVDHNPAFHLQPEAHPHFGMSEPPQVFYRLRELPDGRGTLTLLDQGNVWRGGQLAVLERQFAVELPESATQASTLPGFRHALTILTPQASRTGVSEDGLWRDPTAMPDGSLIVVHAPGPLDLTSTTLAPHPDLVRVVLRADRPTLRVAVQTLEVLRHDDALPWSQPVAILARPTEDPPHARNWNDTDTTATVVHSGVQVIEALLAQLPPSAARTIRTDIEYVRLVTPVSIAGKVDATPVPAAETRHGMVGATRASLTGRMPLFAAIEIPPAADGSLTALVPPHVPVRVVTLDKDRVAVGALQHQWYATLPGERFPVGTQESAFAVRCAGCHGAMDGQASSVLQPLADFVTQASVTDAAYKDHDRHSPLTPPLLTASFFTFVDFQQDVQPILTQKCASAGCHAGATPAGGLSLTNQPTQHYTDAYESLLRPGTGSAHGFAYVDAVADRARDSYLWEHVTHQEWGAPRTVGVQCPPLDRPQLTEAERWTISRWIEFGATFVGVPAAEK